MNHSPLLPVTASTSSSGVGAEYVISLSGEKGMLVFRFRPSMKLCTWHNDKKASLRKMMDVVLEHEWMFFWIMHLPGPTLSRVEQSRVTEERSEHSLDPAGLSGAGKLFFCLRVFWSRQTYETNITTGAGYEFLIKYEADRWGYKRGWKTQN